MTFLAKQILNDAKQVRGKHYLLFLLPCCSALTVIHCFCEVSPANQSLRGLQAEEEALLAWQDTLTVNAQTQHRRNRVVAGNWQGLHISSIFRHTKPARASNIHET